ncbi:MAG: segregation/condensation protein A [Opitutales bacterium]
MLPEKNTFEDSLLFSKEDIAVKLPIFEGPLDLLLFLIKRNEIDIYDIPIENITKQYVDILRDMEHLDLEIAGEFFVMAANLMYIKSRMLLPLDEALHTSDDDEDEPSDPRWELVEQLLEYKKIKQSAFDLEELIYARQLCVFRYCEEKDIVTKERELAKTDKIELWNCFNLVLRRLSESLIKGEIIDEQVTVADRMEFILKLEQKDFTFSSLFTDETKTYMFIVSSLIAVLELCRLHKLEITQNDTYDEILCSFIEEEKTDIQTTLMQADNTL